MEWGLGFSDQGRRLPLRSRSSSALRLLSLRLFPKSFDFFDLQVSVASFCFILFTTAEICQIGRPCNFTHPSKCQAIKAILCVFSCCDLRL